MYNLFDRLNAETKAYNNGYGERKMGWYDATGIYSRPTTTTNNWMTKKGHYDGRGCWVED
jgi:hypothetical protein